jgi:PKD repeat protein
LVDGSSLALAWRNTFEGGAPTSVTLDVTGSIVGSVPLGLRDSATFAGVPPGTYTVRVRGVNAAGTSAGSNPVTLTLPESCSGAPLPPASFLAYKLGSAVHVVWDPASTGPAPTSYALSVGGTFNLTIPTSNRSLSGVVPPGTYNLSVAATNACGTSAATRVQVITVP